jgi:hypothetical protein
MPRLNQQIPEIGVVIISTFFGSGLRTADCASVIALGVLGGDAAEE